jgi:hypothetical protein
MDGGEAGALIAGSEAGGPTSGVGLDEDEDEDFNVATWD